MKDLIKVVTADGQIVYVPPGSSVFVDGAQVPDPTPVEMPLGFEHPESLEMLIARLVRQVSRAQADIGEESVDDANDFDVDDEDLLEDTFTDSELAAIMAAPEMREQVLKENVDGGAEDDTGNSGFGEADGGAGEGVRRGGSGDRVRDGRGEGDSRGSARRDKGVESRRASKGNRVAADSADAGEGDE